MPTFQELTSQSWRFVATGKLPHAASLGFLETGEVIGHAMFEGCRWSLDPSGRLEIFGEEARPIAAFEESFRVNRKICMGAVPAADGEVPAMTLENAIPGMEGKTPWTCVALQRFVNKHGWKIGDYSYGVPKVHDATLGKLTIGRFCSIAPGVEIALGNHRGEIVSTYPFASLGWSGARGTRDHDAGDVSIGSDVWIGAGAFITPGVTVGHGAIIAARAVVTKDVAPYAIVGGVPAKVLRFRFDEATVARLLEAAWWDWDYEDINAALPWIMAGDVSGLDSASDDWKNRSIFGIGAGSVS